MSVAVACVRVNDRTVLRISPPVGPVGLRAGSRRVHPAPVGSGRGAGAGAPMVRGAPRIGVLPIASYHDRAHDRR